MSDRTYKCANARAVAARIWNADFYLDSFNELVESRNPDVVVASVGLSDVSGPDQKLSMLATINNHPWGQDIIDFLLDDIRGYEPPLLEWSVAYKHLSWTVTMSWRQ